MRVLAFASQKSGAGKTTLAGHIAVQAQRAGTKPVVLVDLDPDASLTDWFALREEDDEPLKVARSTLKDLSTKLQQLRADGVELVVIDTPPTLHQAIDESIIAADLVAIPTRPCAHDLAAAGATVELVQSHGKPFCFVVNGTEPDGELTADVVMALAQHGSIATVSIPRSVAMLETMVDGRTVMELPDNPGARLRSGAAVGLSGQALDEVRLGGGRRGCAGIRAGDHRDQDVRDDRLGRGRGLGRR